MKLLALISLFLISFSSFSQDQLVFKDGYNWPCKIVSIKNGEITFIRYDEKEEAVSQAFIQEYFYKGKWHEITADGIVESEMSNSLIRPSIFVKPTKFESGKFSIATNPILPFISIDLDQIPQSSYSDRTLGRYFSQTSRSLSLVPEYRFKDKFSLAFPIIIGLDFSTPTPITVSAGSDYGTFARFDHGSADTLNVKSLTLRDARPRATNGHAKNVLFQAGIAPKLFPFGHGVLAPYFSLGMHVGLIDAYQIDYYFDFEYEVIGSNNDYVDYSIVSEEARRYSHKQFFFRWDLLAGFEINMSRVVSLGFEVAWVSNHYVQGGTDRYYARYFDRPYELMGTNTYNNPAGRFGYPLGRAQLIFHLSKKSTQ